MTEHEQNQYPIDVDLTSRPIQIVFIVPAAEDPTSHLILDAVFKASYAAWNGGYFLIVPAGADGALAEPYRAWMRAIDPDWIYSYVDLPEDLITTLNRELCPMAFLRHEMPAGGNPPRAADFSPSFDSLERPLSSTTCLFDVARPTGAAFPTVLASYLDENSSRFLADNFGFVRFHRDEPGLCAVTLLCARDLPQSHATSVNRIHEEQAVVTAIREGRLSTAAGLARAVRIGQPAIREFRHHESLFLTVGESVLDRINAWNRRLLIDGHLDAAASLRMSLTDVANGALCYEVVQLLLRMDSGDRLHINLCSESHQEAEIRAALSGLTGRLAPWFLRKVTWSTLPAYPVIDDDDDDIIRFPPIPEGAATIVHKPNQPVHLPRPDHVHHLPPSYGAMNHGAWMTTACIGRSDAESMYANIGPRWVFPRRAAVARMVTSAPSRIDQHGRVAILAHARDAGHWGPHEPLRTAPIQSPRVEDVLASAIATHGRRPGIHHYDATPKKYRRLQVSDKGQHLQGVIKLFDGLEQAGAFVANAHWRALLTAARDARGRQVRWSAESVHEFADRPAVVEAIASSGRTDRSAVNAILRARVRDALESFLQHRIVYRGHEWRCDFCGNDAIVGIGRLAETMTCDICARSYALPLDLTLSFTWNDFLHQALISANGLPVLWALNRARSEAQSCFAWMPEVLIDWRDGSPGNEIDYLAIIDGRVIACEAKAAVALFLKSDPAGVKFASVISRLGVDEAVLAFERIGRPDEDPPRLRQELTRVVAEIGNTTGIPVRFIIAEESPSFRGPPTHFGTFGTREQDLRQ